MAEEQKTTVPETTPAVEAPVAVETKPEETTETPAAEPVVEAPKETTETPAADAPAEAAETTEAAAEDKKDETKDEEPKKEEAKPIEAGNLEHKGAPASFPKNIMYSKNHFWFGTDAIEKEKLAAYMKNEKVSTIAHHVVSWASETGKGLLFYGKEADKATPAGAIQLADASEPVSEGANKFSLTSKGHKHTFKAPSAADRDNWVAQIKAKIVEAKELAATVPETETYKKTMESLKPAPAAKKEEKPAVAEPAKEEAKAEETPAIEEAKTEEPAKEETKEEPKEEKKEEPKRRSASRKRTSIFGSLLGKKEEAKKEEAKPAEEAAVETPAAEETADKPAEEAEVPAAEPAAETTETPAAEETKEEPKKEEPKVNKRASIFSSLSFGSKKKPEAEAAPATPAKDTPTESAPVAESAPVIPAVETTEPLSTEAKPTEEPAAETPAAEETVAATNGETKKDVKSEKRKSSLPFAFGKKEKAATSDEETEKPKSPPFFSKLRQTVKGKGKATEKPAEKPEDKVEETEETPAEAATEEAKTEEPAKEEAKEETPAESATAPGPVPVAEAEKAVPAAAAPVTAAA